MLGVIEPSDLVVQCKFKREGIVMSEDSRLMRRGLGFRLDISDYTEYPEEKIMERCGTEPRVSGETDVLRRVHLVGETLTPCFFTEELEAIAPALVRHNQEFNLDVVCAGSYAMEQNEQVLSPKVEDSFLIAARAETYQIWPEGGAQLVMVHPGKDMDTL